MLGSISPVGEASRRQRWWLTATAYLLASAAGGVVVGAASGAAGALLTVVLPMSAPLRLLLLALAIGVAAVLDRGARRWRLPTWHRQVDERWLTSYRGWVYGAGFGLQLGLAVVTIVPSAVTYAMLAAAVLTGTWQMGALIGVVFGAVRAAPLLLTATLRSPARLHGVTGAVAASEAAVHRGVVVGQALLASAAAVAAALVVAG